MDSDVGDCYVSDENSLFKINSEETIISHVRDKTETIYYIDSKQNENLNIKTFVTHTKTGERLKLSFDSKTIVVQSLNYPEITLSYKIRPQ